MKKISFKFHGHHTYRQLHCNQTFVEELLRCIKICQFGTPPANNDSSKLKDLESSGILLQTALQVNLSWLSSLVPSQLENLEQCAGKNQVVNPEGSLFASIQMSEL
jgi:hypothetical protein